MDLSRPFDRKRPPSYTWDTGLKSVAFSDHLQQGRDGLPEEAGGKLHLRRYDRNDALCMARGA